MALLAAACGTPELDPVWVWDAEAACFREDPDGLDPADLPAEGCVDGRTPAQDAAGRCVLLPIVCVPRGFAPPNACPDAVAAFQAGATLCE